MPFLINFVGLNMAAPTILTHGTEAQKQKFIPGCLSGEEIWCQGFSEPGAGSDMANQQTLAVRDGNDWIVNGHKVWTSRGHFAKWMILLARMAQGKDEALMSSLLRHAFALGVGLHTDAGMKRAVEAAGLDWAEAQKVIDGEEWKAMVERNQDEMVDGLGLWGVPSFRLSGPEGEPELAVWGQDRLWFIATEIKSRASLLGPEGVGAGTEGGR